MIEGCIRSKTGGSVAEVLQTTGVSNEHGIRIRVAEAYPCQLVIQLRSFASPQRNEAWKRLWLLPKQIGKRNRNCFRRDLQVFKRDPLIGTMSVCFKQRPWTRAVNDRRYARLAIQAGIGIKRHAFGRNVTLQRNQRRPLQRL